MSDPTFESKLCAFIVHSAQGKAAGTTVQYGDWLTFQSAPAGAHLSLNKIAGNRIELQGKVASGPPPAIFAIQPVPANQKPALMDRISEAMQRPETSNSDANIENWPAFSQRVA